MLILSALLLILVNNVFCQNCEDTIIGSAGVEDTAGTANLCQQILSVVGYPSISCYDGCYTLSGLYEGPIMHSYNDDSTMRDICSHIQQQGDAYGIGGGCNTLVCTGGGQDFVNANIYASSYVEGTCGEAMGGERETTSNSYTRETTLQDDGVSIDHDGEGSSEGQKICEVGAFFAFTLQEGPSDVRNLCDTVRKVVGSSIDTGANAYPLMCCVGNRGYAVCPSSGKESCNGRETVSGHNERSSYVCVDALPLVQQTLSYAECNCIGCHWEKVEADGLLLSKVDFPEQILSGGDDNSAPSGTCPATDPVPSASFAQVCELAVCAETCESTLSAIETEINRLGPALEGFADTFINAVKSKRRRHSRSLLFSRKPLQDNEYADLSGGQAYLGRGSRPSVGTVGQVYDWSSQSDTPSDTGSSSADTSDDLGVLSFEAWGDYSGSTITESDVQELDEAIGSVASPMKRLAELHGLKGLDLYPGEVQLDLSAGNLFTVLAKNVVKECNSLAGNFADVAADLKGAPNPVSYVKAYTKYFSTVSCLWCCFGVAIDELRPLNCEEDCSRATVASTAWGYRASRYMDKCK